MTRSPSGRGTGSIPIQVTGSLDTCPDATFYWLWDIDGLYFFADVKDTTAPNTVHARNIGSYNSGDGVQFLLCDSSWFDGYASNKFTLSLEKRESGQWQIETEALGTMYEPPTASPETTPQTTAGAVESTPGTEEPASKGCGGTVAAPVLLLAMALAAPIAIGRKRDE